MPLTKRLNGIALDKSNRKRESGMTTLKKFRSARHPGTFELNGLYHTITKKHDLFEIRYRHETGGGNGFAIPSELLFADPDADKLLKRYLEWDATAVEI